MNVREQAAENGLKTYSTGKRCKRNHPSVRYVSTGLCVECTKLYGKRNTEYRNKIRNIRIMGKTKITVIIYPEYEQAIYDYVESLNAAHELGL